MTKRQEEIPSNNNQDTNNVQLLNNQTFGYCKLVIENCLMIGIWLLVIRRNEIPVNVSTSGYCQLNFLWQHLVFPPKIKNDKTGIKSYQTIFFPQKSQCDRPLILSSLGRRSINTLRKENRCNTDLRDSYEKLGIKKEISGHFHESGHRANDRQNKHVPENAFIDELFWNSGCLDSGQCGILIVEDNKVAYKNIRLQEHI